MGRDIIIVGVILFIALLFVFKGFGHGQLPTPGEELRAECLADGDCISPNLKCESNRCVSIYPQNSTCWGRDVEVLGRPTYHMDPAMKHMKGHPCASTNQCRVWPPEGTKTGDTECCPQEGWCYKVN